MQLNLNSALLAAPFTIGATGLNAIIQNIRVIITTTAYSCCLDRAFAHGCGFVDAPAPHEVARLVAELTRCIEKYEPRVKVSTIRFAPDPQAAQDGRLYPRISFELKPGAL